MANLLEPGDMLPARQMRPLTGGSPVRVGPTRARTQVLVLTHRERCDGCAAYIDSFRAVADQMKTEKAVVLALVGPQWDAPAPETGVSGVVDDGDAFSALLSPEGEPVVAVVDRYGQLFNRFDAGADHDFPDHDRLVNHLLDIALRCPECGVPDVPSGSVLPEAGTKSAGIHVHQ